MHYPDLGEFRFKEGINFDDDTSLDEIFFENFFPSLAGHSLLMDEFYRDPWASYNSTIINEKINYNDD